MPPLKIAVMIQADDTADEDAASSTGLTQAAYDRLVDGLSDAGFSIWTGPDRVYDDQDRLDIEP